MRKIIIADDGSQPSLIGQWTVAEIQQAAQFLLNWVGSIPLHQPPSAMPALSADDPPKTYDQPE